MFKFKKRIAVLLAATMVLGSTVTVFADDVPGTQTLNATGASEGHVERRIANVVLPTVSGAAFNYTIDPERLVKETNGEKYAGVTFTDDAKAKGVYFLVDTNEYDNKTAAEDKFKFTNKSTFPIDVTVEVKAKDATADTDIALVSKNAIASATDASLYLGLKVGSEEFVPVLKDEPASITVSVNAVKDNFKTTVSGNKYVYAERTTGLTDWLTTSFQIEGETTDGNKGEGPQIAKDTTAPALEITWKWAENGAPTSYVSDTTISGTNNVLTLTLPEGITVSSVKCKTATTDYAVLPTARYTVANGKITFVKETVNAFSGGNFKIVYSDGHEDELTIQ